MKGLTKKEVNDRINKGLINNHNITYSRTIKAIIFDNTLTIFNIINLVLFILVLTTGSFQNSGFLGIVIVNTIIAIYQEIKAKKIIDKIKINNQSKVKVIRDYKEIFPVIKDDFKEIEVHMYDTVSISIMPLDLVVYKASERTKQVFLDMKSFSKPVLIDNQAHVFFINIPGVAYAAFSTFTKPKLS